MAAVQKDANLVELEKCCRAHIFLQNFVLIQPRTSPPKICKIFENVFSKNAFSKNAFSKNAFSKNAFSKNSGELHGEGVHRRRPGRVAPAGGDVRERRLAKFRQNVARFRLYRLRLIYQIIKLKFLKFGKIWQILRHLRNFC